MASSSAAAAKRMITLKSFEGELFEVDEKVAMESQTITHMIEDGCADNAIPVPNVNAPTLAKVIEYCKRHVEAAAAQIDAPSGSSEAKAKRVKDASAELKAWDAEFVDLDQSDLLDLVLAANYLSIKGLLKLTCQTVANMMKGKSAEEIRAMFNIINDLTPEEEEEIRRENAWAFE